MEDSDDESETIASNVSNYEFVSGDGMPVSFAMLPLEWNEGEMHDTKREQIFLSGKTDNGLRKIFKRVIAWKFDISFVKPEISVLLQEGYWINLLKPRKAFEVIIRTILIAVHFVHFVKWNPQRSQQALWDHLDKSLSMFERRPSEDDLADHLPLIKEAAKSVETLANSKLLTSFLEEPLKRKTYSEVEKLPFIVDDVDENDNQVEGLDNIDDGGDVYLDENDVCAICDNGGKLYICDGKCMRYFHATAEDGDESQCASLNLTDKQLEMFKDISFICDNCKYKRHQCFACGKLGSSDESSSPEVFCCANGACGFFYHPQCVAKLLHPGDGAVAEEHHQKIAAGEKFACPAHRCDVCKELEVRSIRELQFAVCRRCPRAYHRKCLPREISFEENENLEQRAWEGLISHRILIYCLDHEIDPTISTPARDHIIFLDSQQKKKNKVKSVEGKMLKERGFALERKMIYAKPHKGIKKLSSSSKHSGFSRRSDGTSAVRSGSVHCEHEKTHHVDRAASRLNKVFTLDADTKKRIFELIKDASSSLTLDQVKKMYESPSTHTQYSNCFVDSITLGKVEGSVQSLRAALNKLEGSGCIQDAKMVCGSDLINQMWRWKDKIKVHLSPFLYGVRYTSFGRHFTKIDKLKQVVDMLHWYFQDGDMLVDFCCGSNDFSCLMAKKLDKMGRRCSFKNYDLQLPKSDFCFEQRDWMSVTPDELPDGSKLIMGLNPPFGLHAALANKFINKALEFKPKLLILIVPRETERLDKKKFPYDLIWQDGQMCTGKSFYLPGSIDIHDKQLEDWNVNPPVLYTWSHPSCTSRYKAIAKKHGHPFGGQRKCKLEGNHYKIHANRKRKRRSNSGMSPEYLRASKRPMSHHKSLNVAKTHSPVHLECPSKVHSRRHQPLDQTNLPTHHHHHQPHAQADSSVKLDDLVRKYNLSGGRSQQTWGSADNHQPHAQASAAYHIPWNQGAYPPQSYQGPGFQVSYDEMMGTSAMQIYDPWLEGSNHHGWMDFTVHGQPLPPLIPMHDASGIYHPPPHAVRPSGFASGWLNNE